VGTPHNGDYCLGGSNTGRCSPDSSTFWQVTVHGEALDGIPQREPMKSQVNLIVDLLEQMLCSDPCGLASSKHLRMDVKTLRLRTHHEGLSFLTKTLPLLGKALDAGLSSLHFNLPSEFRCSHGQASIPAFMQAYFKCIFDDSGHLRDDAEPDVIKHVRQVLFLAYKLEVPYTSKQLNESFETFIANDAELEPIHDEETLQILEVASFIAEDVFRGFNPKEILPRHGPGAVATGEQLEEKWVFSRLYNNIHQYYPYYEYFIVGDGDELIDRKEWYLSMQRLDQGQAKVIAVPKDSRGPRLISCEPLEFQWIQQGLGRSLVSRLESHPLTKGYVNFTDQSINQALALECSITRTYATIDLKDASDRVSSELVSAIFKRCPELLKALMACRTSATALPDGRVVELQKYAPMGSALCFPVEAFVFWAILVASISRHQRRQLALVDKEVFVYGDDIIIPTEFASLCLQTLESVNLRVNRQKCCIQGVFRESCGVDAFKGVNITPTRLHTPWSGRKTDGSAYASYTAIANTFVAKGYVKCADLLWKELEKTYGKIPYGTSRAAYPCKIVTDPVVAEVRNRKLFRYRYSRRYQRIEFYLPMLIPRKIKSKLDGWPRLLRNVVFRKIEDPSNVVIPRSTVIKRGWTATF